MLHFPAYENGEVAEEYWKSKSIAAAVHIGRKWSDVALEQSMRLGRSLISDS